MRYRLKHVCEYVFLRTVGAVLRLLPYRGALSVGYLIAWLAFHVFKYRVREAKERVRAVFGDRFSEREIRRITWLSWRDFIFYAVDLMRLSLMSMEWIKSHVIDYQDPKRIMQEHCRSGKGAILAIPHMGAWVVGATAMQFFGVPVFFITGRQKNPLVDAYLNRLRGSTGIATVQRGSSLLRSVIRRLRNGEVVAFLPDVRKPTDGVRVEFLGKEANVVEGMGFFARQADVPIITMIPTRRGWSRHHIRLCDPVLSDNKLEKREDWQRMIQEVFRSIEEAIRKQPEQWFWFNRRWILDPL